MTARTKRIYRDACLRSHRILGTYLVIWAWRQRVDCVVVHRSDLHPYLGIKVRRQQRLRWLIADIKNLFPYHEELLQGRTRARGSVYLSRLKFPRDVFDKTMYDVDRAELLTERGLRAAMIPKLPSERQMARFITAAVIDGERKR